MEEKRITIQDGNYTCDIGISVDEWKEILQDETLLTKNCKDAIIKFYNEPNHRATCKALSEKYNISPQALNGTITAFAKSVQKRLNRFKVTGIDNESTYWIIPMTGKYVGEYFEWTIRPELVKAIEETKFVEKSDIIFKDLRDLVNIINKSLGSFCDTFRYKRKELASLKRASSSDILFKYDDDSRDWAINEGGGTELQYHLFYRDNTLGYGLGFNTQYVPFANKMSPVEYIHPFTQGYLQIKNSDLVLKLKKQGFYFVDGTEDELTQLEYNQYYLFGTKIQINNNMIPLSKYTEMITHIKGDLFELYCSIFERRNKLINDKDNNNNMEFVELLRENKNLILTGAPGTGKTYLAKQIALSMLFNKQKEEELTEDEKEIFKNHFCFVQFHPSYDYTDFVEGLRAEDLNGQVLFNLHNGTFKDFCKKALTAQGDRDMSTLYDNLVNQIENGEIETIELKTGKQSKKLSVTTHNRDKNIHWQAQTNGEDSRNAVTKKRILELYKKFDSLEKLNSIENINEEIRDAIKGCNTSMYWAVLKCLLSQSIDLDNRPYIFVIDEINRGEISKIFGELFFSIDPGYRGIKGKVKTQYANIQSNDTIYDYRLGPGWFYIPENVYIIGTMNDIDRSVESMDFAMRRRFAWKEIKSIDRISMWDGTIDDWKDEAKQRMQSLNNAIEKIRGLSSAYHIGPAYFLKLETYKGNFEKLWDIHLQGVLFEYLRGLPDADEDFENLKQAYNLHQ